MNKGFTLIELVIVIAILGILMAIAVPAFSGVSKTAKLAQAKAMAAQMNTYVKSQSMSTMLKKWSTKNLDFVDPKGYILIPPTTYKSFFIDGFFGVKLKKND